MKKNFFSLCRHADARHEMLDMLMDYRRLLHQQHSRLAKVEKSKKMQRGINQGWTTDTDIRGYPRTDTDKRIRIWHLQFWTDTDGIRIIALSVSVYPHFLCTG